MLRSGMHLVVWVALGVAAELAAGVLVGRLLARASPPAAPSRHGPAPEPARPH